MHRTVFVGLLLCASSVTAADDAAKAAWQQFRSSHPYHIQTLAVSRPRTDGERTFVISEPPPDTTLEQLKLLWPREMNRATVQKQSIGVNGWVADVVTVLPPMSDGALTDFVASVTGQLFGTSYKSYAVPLSEGTAPLAKGQVDLKVDTGQLADWFGLVPSPTSTWAVVLRAIAALVGALFLIAAIRKRRPRHLMTSSLAILAFWAIGVIARPGPPQVMITARHHDVDGPTSLQKALTDGGGLYESSNRGLLVFVVPAKTPLDRYAIPLREFALDSDLILGAVGTSTGTAIVARERTQSLSVLPPLRVETLLQLAAVDGDELAQSYERKHIFAGRFDPSQHRDWAPIFLSDELKDTEYGSLLNITDQLLKSWSEHGEIHYANFNYPAPDAYPFPVGLMEYVKTSTVTFNWNTKGVGYADNVGQFDLMAFNRTGALPVDYLGERDARLREAEDQAYEYFANRQDPNLARVVQYAGLYQIFRHYEIKATPRGSHSLDNVPERELLAPTVAFIRDIQRESMDDFVTPRMRQVAELKPIIEDFEAVKVSLDQFHNKYGAKGETELARAVLEPRAFQRGIKGEPSEFQRAILELSYGLSDSEIVKERLSDERSAVMFMYQALSGVNEHTWIHTPSLVVSWPIGPNAEDLEGGHNLSSRITRFVARADLSPGEVKVVDVGGERTIYHAVSDESRVHAAVRSAGRSGEADAGAVERMVADDMAGAPAVRVPMRDALMLGDFTSNTERGLLTAHVGVPLRPNATWSYGATTAAHSARLTAMDRPGILAAVVEREPNGLLLTFSGGRGTIRAPDTTSAMDALVARIAERGQEPLKIDLRFVNFEPQQAEGFTRNAEMRLPQARRAPLSGFVEPPGGLTPKLSEAISEGHWDASRTAVSSAPTAAGGVAHTIEIPAMEAATSSPLRIVIEATSEAAARVRSAIDTFVRNIATITNPDQLLAAIHEFLNSLHAIPGIKRIDPVLKEQAADIYIVDNRPLLIGHAAD